MVLATKGHIKDLPPKDYGIDFKNDFEPTYVWLKGKKTFFASIKKTAKLASEIYIASDPDREGEVIAQHISEELGHLKAPQYRIRLTEISKIALENALKTPGSIDRLLVESQICRRLIDRIFGFEISPALWKNLRISNLSAGRVQSAVLKWICERELEIRNFISQAYVNLTAIIEYGDEEISLAYVLKEEDKKIDPNSARQVLAKYGLKGPGKTKEGTQFELKRIESKDYKNYPPLPFSTASLQETAAKVLGFSSSHTMKIAQILFEGKRIGGEIKGLITYMRTDSNQVSKLKQEAASSYLKRHRPELNIAKQRNVKSKLHAQESHEAISPTDPSLTPESIKNYLSRDELSLYQLIWERLLSSLLEPETGIELSYFFESKGEEWLSRQKKGISLGYKSFSNASHLPMDELSGIKNNTKVDCKEIVWEDKKTTPKDRYTEGQIIAKMEKTGIGRPSTYAQTLDTLKKRKYILEVKKKLGASVLGEKVNAYLVDHFSSLIGEQFTKEMETTLDALALGTGERSHILKLFYEKINDLKSKRRHVKSDLGAQTKSKYESIKKIESDFSSSQTLCPVCKEGRLKSKFSKNGKTIYFCSRYPQCDFVSYEPTQNE